MKAGIRLQQDTLDDFRPVTTIAEGAAVSSSVPVSKIGPRGFAVILPAAWTAADIGIDVSVDGDTWHPLKNADGRVKITDVGTSNDPRPLRSFPAEAWAAGVFEFVRLVSINTSTEASVNQAAARELTLVLLS